MDIKYLYNKVKSNNLKTGENYSLLIISIVITVWSDVSTSNKKTVLYTVYNEQFVQYNLYDFPVQRKTEQRQLLCQRKPLTEHLC